MRHHLVTTEAAKAVPGIRRYGTAEAMPFVEFKFSQSLNPYRPRPPSGEGFTLLDTKVHNEGHGFRRAVDPAAISALAPRYAAYDS